MSDPERRKKPRIQKQYYAQINVEGSNDWHSVTLQNLSSGGMSFLYENSLSVGSTVKAKINFPPADGQVEVKGQVIRSVSKNSLYAIVIGFYDIADKHSDLINQFAAQWFPLQNQ